MNREKPFGQQCWRTVATATLLMLLGAVPRVARLHRPLHMDEGFAINVFLRAPVRKTFTHFEVGQNHPLYNLLARVVSWASLEPWAIRLPALVAGIASVPVLFLFLRPHTGAVPACLAAAALALTAHQIEYGAFARGYSLAVLGTIVASGLLLTGIQSDRRAIWFGYVAALVAAAYAQIWILVVLVGHAMFIVLRGRRIGSCVAVRFPLSVMAALSMSALLYAAMVPDILLRFHEQSQLWFAPRLWEAIRDNCVFGQPGLELGQWTVAVNVFMLGTIALAFWRRQHQKSLVGTLHAAIVLAGLAVAAAVRPAVFYSRYLFFLFPSYSCVFAVAVSALLTIRNQNGNRRETRLATILALGGSIAAVVSVATVCLCPAAPGAWPGLVQVPQVAASLLLLSWLLEPLSGWKRLVTCAGLAVAGGYSAVVLALELTKSPFDRTLTTVVAIPLVLLVTEELRETQTETSEVL